MGLRPASYSSETASASTHTLDRLRRRLAQVTILSSLIAGTLYASYRLDRHVIRKTALDIVEQVTEPPTRVIALSHWVHAHLPTGRNQQYFLFRRLRATSVQVLERGGDCADKSRLLAAMLRELDIPATLAMCFHPQTGAPSHTVVEARIAPDSYMVVDPAFELWFPRPDGQGFYGLTDLRANPNLLFKRLEHLRATLPWPALAFFYPEHAAVYDRVATINWEKNSATRLARTIWSSWYGDEIIRLPRPLAAEEPKLFVIGGLTAMTVTILLCTFLKESVRRKKRKTRAGGIDSRAFGLPEGAVR